MQHIKVETMAGMAKRSSVEPSGELQSAEPPMSQQGMLYAAASPCQQQQCGVIGLQLLLHLQEKRIGAAYMHWDLQNTGSIFNPILPSRSINAKYLDIRRCEEVGVAGRQQGRAWEVLCSWPAGHGSERLGSEKGKLGAEAGPAAAPPYHGAFPAPSVITHLLL